MNFLHNPSVLGTLRDVDHDAWNELMTWLGTIRYSTPSRRHTVTLPSMPQTVAQIPRQIALEERRAATLEQLLANLRQSIARQKFIIAPIRRLPWEMLAIIFEAAVEDDAFFVLALARVCRSFRHAALVYPRLWATFSVNVTNRSMSELLDLFLRRSGTVPLSVTIPRADIGVSYMCQHIGHAYQQLVAAMHMLHTHQHRLRSLSLSVDGIDTAHAAISVCNGPAPELECLHITLDCDWERDNEEFAALRDAFQPCPKLRILKLQHCELPLASFTTATTPFTNLSSLSLNHLCGPLTRLQANIDLMPNLRSLFCIHWHVTHDDMDIPKTVLPSLTTLTVVDESSGTSGLSVLSSLTTPALQHLTLKYLFDAEFWAEYPEEDDGLDYDSALAEVGETVRDFLSRSGWPRLVGLELHKCEMRDEDLLDILRRGDRVEELSLAGRVPANVIRQLSSEPEGKGSACVPRMHTLLLSSASLKPEMIKRLIYVRNVYPLGDVFRPLQTIRFTDCEGISELDCFFWNIIDPARLTIERVATHDNPPRPIDAVGAPKGPMPL